MGELAIPFGMMFSSVLSISVGVITSYSGGVGNIPPGWHLCDGSAGTPDLRDKFIVGAGSSFAVDAEGGSVNHSHDFTSYGHTHSLKSGAVLSAPPEFYSEFSESVLTGTSDIDSSLPPYYALAYIMYLGV